MTDTRKDEVEQMLAVASDLLAQAKNEIADQSASEGIARTVSYSLSLLNVAMSALNSERIPGDTGHYYTQYDVMEENEYLQTLVLKAALEHEAA
ncbi:MAG TPA: hypothetical protein VE994_01655 [Terriglobales bacterium]|nr:hypothetical protein [Terriglobales bacterium]